MVALYHILLQVLCIIGDKKTFCSETYTFQFCVSNNVKKKTPQATLCGRA